MTTVNRYEVFCITENKWVSKWSETVITTCPNNPADSIIANSVTIKETVSDTTMNIKENPPGFYQSVNIPIDIPTGAGLSEHVITFPMTVFLRKVGFNSTLEMMGDSLSIIVGPDTVIGGMIAPISAGSSILTITPQSFDTEYMVKGIYLKLKLIDPSGNLLLEHDAGRIIGVNAPENQITVENVLPFDFPAGTTIVMNVYIMKDVTAVLTNHLYQFGGEVLASKELPANIMSNLIYNNNNGQSKKVYLVAEYFYN
jgi:hypothetical protein